MMIAFVYALIFTHSCDCYLFSTEMVKRYGDGKQIFLC